MALKIKLKQNLRRSILRGHPWIYRESIITPSDAGQKVQLCQLMDKNEFLAWCIYSPTGPLALRVLSLDSKAPKAEFFKARFNQALNLRKSFNPQTTNAFRLINGEGDRLPGLICDIYNNVGVLQFDGPACKSFWKNPMQLEPLLDFLKNTGFIKSIYEKMRFDEKRESGIKNELLWGISQGPEIEVLENSMKFLVNIEDGQKTGFFLDQRDNREFVKRISKGYQVLNLFSYTGGFSVAAGIGGAQNVTSVDLAPEAVQACSKNWELNSLNKASHEGICEDVFEFLKKDKRKWDFIIVDPPSMTHSEAQKALAIKKYTEIFSQAIKSLNRHAHLSLSSCSSHINFDDFQEIINEALAQNKARAQILRISGQGIDHPFVHISHEMRYLKFVHLFVTKLD